jgi:chitin disaccharide deacetylase
MSNCRIIINADDFGKSKDINKAILDCFSRKYISSTTIMANMDGFEDAVNIIHKNNLNNKVGVHLNISEGQPITEEIKMYERFCDSNGYFSNKKYDYKNILESPNKDELHALKNELNAQVKKCKDNGLVITHADSHHHKHTELYMLRLLKDLLKENKISNLRLARTLDNKKSNSKFFYRKLCNTYIKKILKISKVDEFISFENIDKINSDESNIIEIMCHPMYEGENIMEQNEKLENYVKRLRSMRSFDLISYDQL